MKNYKKYMLKNLLFLFIICGVVSCKKDAYLTDGGLANANTSLSTYDYLKEHKYHYFDTVILLIDHFNLKDSVNKAGTFFAFTDFSVNKLMGDLHLTTLDELYAAVSSKLITQYMFSDSSITLANATVNAVQKPNWAGGTALSAVKKAEGNYGVYLTSSAPVFSYYTLIYVKINGVMDGSPGAPPDDEADLSIPCQTSGIKTSTGTTLHVLVNNASLNKL